MPMVDDTVLRRERMKRSKEDHKFDKITETPKVNAKEIQMDKTGIFKSFFTFRWMVKKKKHNLRFPIMQRRTLNIHPEHSFIITMLFANGTLKTFVLNAKGTTFEMNKRTYHLFYEESWFDISLNQYHLFYHENLPVPINREISKQGDESYFNVNPDNLKDLLAGEYVKILVKANQITDALKTLTLLAFIQLGVGIITLLVLWKMSKG